MPYRMTLDLRNAHSAAERQYRLDAACQAVEPLVGSDEVLTWYPGDLKPGIVVIEIIRQADWRLRA